MILEYLQFVQHTTVVKVILFLDLNFSKKLQKISWKM